MKVRVGTSGYSYTAWKGSFFPEDLPSSKMLAFYAEKLPTVEINNTFYRMPSSQLVAKWAEQVPPSFVFVLKAPQRITHQKQLINAEDEVRYFLETAGVLGPKLGPLLFQLPPFLKKDLPRLNDFLSLVPRKSRPAFEFRHSSWFDDQVFEALRARGAALCAADTDEAEAALVTTAPFGYLRLRRTEYRESDLRVWAERVRNSGWEEAYVFFKHEEAGTGPRYAGMLRGLLGEDAVST